MMRAAARCVEQGGTRTGDTSVGARPIHVGLRRCTVAPGGQKVDPDCRTAMYQRCIRTADTNPYQ